MLMLELGPPPNPASLIRMARPAPLARLLHVIDKPLTPPKIRISAVRESVELWILFVAIDDEVMFNHPIARRFALNSLFETVMLDPPPKNALIPLLVLPANLLLSITALTKPRVSVSMPLPPSGPDALLFWIRLRWTFV